MRRRASTTIPAFRRSWAAGDTCCHVHPPQPAARAGHGGATRSGDASSTSTTTARAKSLRSSVSRTRTRSPGRAPSTNTTRPPSSRARAAPPATTAVGTRSRSGVTPPAWTLPDRMAARPSRQLPLPAEELVLPPLQLRLPLLAGQVLLPPPQLLLPQAELGLLLPLPDDRAEAVEVDAEVGPVLGPERPSVAAACGREPAASPMRKLARGGRPAISHTIEPMSGRNTTISSHTILGRLRTRDSSVVITSTMQ